MEGENETHEDVVREARDKYTVHECNECNWRKSCMDRKFGDSECVNERQSISLAFGIEDGYFSGLLDRIEAAYKREVAELRRRLKVAEDALDASLNYNNSDELDKAQRKARRALAAIRAEKGEII